MAYANFFASTAFEDVALARVTNVGKARKRLLLGACHQTLYQSAVGFAATRHVDTERPEATVIPMISVINQEELGAGEGDMQMAHGARLFRLHSLMAVQALPV